jgi:regulator of sigma E protease
MPHASSLDYLVVALGLAVLMIVHECGHFFVARAYGMRVTKFSIGFGPTFFKILPKDGYFWFTTAAGKIRLRLWKHDPERHGPTVYQVAMIPFLAYVQIAGMNPLEDIEENDKGSYANASLLARILTIFAGPLANYLFASVFFFAAFLRGGQDVPQIDEPGSTEVTVMVGSVAEAAGLKNGDRIVEVDARPIDKWTEMAEVIGKHPDENIHVVVERNGQRVGLDMVPKRLDPAPGKKGPSRGLIGVRPHPHHVDLNAREAALLAFKEPPRVVKSVVIGLSEWASGQADGELSGPVGMVQEGAKALKGSFNLFLVFLGSLSAYLGAFNLIPFPALDGGRLMFLGYEATTRRRPNARIEMHIHLVGLFMMLGLTFYVTLFKDLRRSSREEPPNPFPAASSSAKPAPPPAETPPSEAPTTAPAAPAPTAEPTAPGGK